MEGLYWMRLSHPKRKNRAEQKSSASYFLAEISVKLLPVQTRKISKFRSVSV